MSDMKCPFCRQELESHNYTSGRFRHTVICVNKDCKLDGVVLPKIIWQELIRTRKVLDVAVDALDAGKTLADIAGFKMLVAGLEEALAKITALEQNDK